MIKLDSLDEHLLIQLNKDARQSSKELAKALKTSPATVRRRIQRLLQDEVMAFIAIVDPEKVGLSFVAVLTLNVDPRYLEAAVEHLINKDQVAWLATTTGRFDIMATLQFVSMNELNDFLREELPKIEGLKNSETFVCLSVRKAPYIKTTKK